MPNELELKRVSEWNFTDVEYPRHLCIHELFEHQVERTPDAVALRCGNQSLTYRALNNQANQLAHHLVGLGVGPEKIVGVCLERSLELIVSLFAVMKAGGAYLPLDATYPSERLELMLRECAAELIVTRGSLAKRLPLDGRKQVLLDDSSFSISSNPNTTPSSPVNSENLAYVIYTSGSTGLPKGVAESHRAVVNFLHWANTRFPMTTEDVFLQIAPFTFDASVFEIFTTLCSGAALLLIKQGGQREPDYLVRLMRECGVTVASFVPPTLRMLIEEEEFSAIKSLRRAFCGGEVMALDLMLRFQRRSPAELVNLYGPTEVSVYCTGWVCAKNWQGASPPIGNPIFNTQVYLLDEAKKLVFSPGVGEIYLGGAGLSRGYINRPQVTAERFVPNPFSSDPSARLYRTGDLGFWNADGTIGFVGRADDQIKLRGFRIEPAEIETALLNSPKISQALVICREDAPGNQQLVAYCISAPGERIPAVADLRSLLGRSLPDYMIPSVFVEIAKFPINANGKRDRKALPAPSELSELSDEADGIGRQGLPKDLLEQRLLELWQKILGRKNIGIHDNFFDLGGHSLTAAMLTTEIEKLAYERLPIAVFFQAPTVAELAAYLKKNRDDPAWSSLVPLQPAGDKTPLFIMHGMGGDVFAYLDFARHLAPDRAVYGLQAVGLDGIHPGHDSLEKMADYYADQIRAIHPRGPYYLLGYSLGGWIAYAVADQLIKKGGRIALLLLLDTEAEAKVGLGVRFRQHLALHLEQAFQQRKGILPLCDYGWRLVCRQLHRRLFPQEETPCRPIVAHEGNAQRKASPDLIEQACGRYEPPPLQVQMELFIPSERKPWQIDFWRYYALQGVRIHYLFEWHQDYIDPANAATLARVLRPLLTEADSK
jgi:amino acid adenylation domain-containing protein